MYFEIASPTVPEFNEKVAEENKPKYASQHSLVLRRNKRVVGPKTEANGHFFICLTAAKEKHREKLNNKAWCKCHIN